MTHPELETFARDHQAELYRYLRFLGATRDVAEEVMQETFLAVLNSRTIPPETQAGRQSAWLRGVARNCLMQHHRKARKGAIATDPQVLQETIDRAESYWVEQFLAGGDGFDYVQAMRRCMDRLPAGQRRAVDLFYVEDASRMEMASSLNMTEDGVKSLLRRVRAALAGCVKMRLGASAMDRLISPNAVPEGSLV